MNAACPINESGNLEELENVAVFGDGRVVLFDDTAARSWMREIHSGRDVIRVSPLDWKLADQWLSEALRSAAMRRQAAEWAASLIDGDAEMLMNVSPPLRAGFAERLLAAAGGELRGAAALCVELLGWSSQPLRLDGVERWQAFAEIAPASSVPAMVMDGRERFVEALELGDRLAASGMPVALRTFRESWDKFLAEPNWRRFETRWRLAMVFTGARDLEREKKRRSWMSEEFVRARVPGALPLLEKARSAVAPAKERDPLSSAARSAAEAFLHAVLEAGAFTRSRFQLNALLDFPFGSRAAEGDLVDSAARLVIEIDGYHHFREPDCYRTDRRKDSLYQEHGWFVIRFLAEDVVGRIAEVLQSIESVLARRLSDRSQPATHEPTDTD